MYEVKRQENKPDIIKILFIGESRPQNGTFFYLENSILFKETKKVFDKLLNTIFNCEIFKNLGCWLYDVCEQPINSLSPSERNMCIKKRIPQLLDVIRGIKPEYVLVIKLGSLAANIKNALDNTNDIVNNIYYLPFPANGNQKRYRNELYRILESIYS